MSDNRNSSSVVDEHVADEAHDEPWQTGLPGKPVNLEDVAEYWQEHGRKVAKARQAEKAELNNLKQLLNYAADQLFEEDSGEDSDIEARLREWCFAREEQKMQAIQKLAAVADELGFKLVGVKPSNLK